jgi:single-stranded-DNA-specific exonuclease
VTGLPATVPPEDPARAYDVRPPDPDAARELGRACGLGPAAAQVLLHRGLHGADAVTEFLEARLSGLTAPDGMVDRDVAVDRIARAVRNRERIVVFGDYDVDGTTSCALLADALEALGGDVHAFVASRFDGGYGFSDVALARCRDVGAQLIITCDCGSSDHERIAAARGAGIDVVVVDHHLVPDEPLPAVAFINPHRSDCGFPYKGLASVGLVLTLAAGVRSALGSALDLRGWLDLVALGTVADVAPLDGDNRRLVRAGLRLLGSPDARPGVVALRETANVRPGTGVGAVDIAFRLAPRLNAAGRLGDPTVTLDLLRARTVAEARASAARIEQVNDVRKAIGQRMVEEADAQVRDVYGAAPTSGVVVASLGWNRGVVGIVAARLVDRLDVPVLCIALGEDGMGHGSARAPDGWSVYDALARCRALLTAFGGHRAAAGFSLEAGRVEALRQAFGEATRDRPEASGAASHLVDVELDGSTFPLPQPADLERLEPVGAGNAEPLFALRDVRVVDRRLVGDHHLKLALELGGTRLSAFGPRMADRVDVIPPKATLLGHLRPNTWAGRGLELHLV